MGLFPVGSPIFVVYRLGGAGTLSQPHGYTDRGRSKIELWSALGNYSPGVVAVVLSIYFSNQLTLRYLDERKEMLKNLTDERKEWVAAQERMLDRYDTRLHAAVEAMAKMQVEMHALRSRIQEFILKIEMGMQALEKRLSGGSRD